MSMMQKLRSCKIMMKSKSGLKKQRKFHYLLGLTGEQAKLNAEALLEWCKDKQYVEGIKDYANQLQEKNKT